MTLALSRVELSRAIQLRYLFEHMPNCLITECNKKAIKLVFAHGYGCECNYSQWRGKGIAGKKLEKRHEPLAGGNGRE